MTLEEQDEIRIGALEDMQYLIRDEYPLGCPDAPRVYREVIQFAIEKAKDQWGINLTGDAA